LAATLTFTLSEAGGNVELTATGTANLTGLTFNSSQLCGFEGLVAANTAALCVGTRTSGNRRQYDGLTGPSNFGTGGFVSSTTGTGDGIAFTPTSLQLPTLYVSGDPLNATATFSGRTLVSMGVTPGTYTWTYGTNDTVVLTVTGGAGVANVPTLSEYALMALAGLLVLFAVPALRRRV